MKTRRRRRRRRRRRTKSNDDDDDDDIEDERLKNVFSGIDNTTSARFPFAFGGSFLDKNEDETALTTGDDGLKAPEEKVEEVPKKKDLDEEVAKQNALQLLEEEEYGRDGRKRQGESSGTSS